MNRFQQFFNKTDTKAFVPFFTLGDPNPKASFDIIKAAIDAGADALELGIAFSDPIADGPVNQRSMQRAVLAGANFDRCLQMLAELRNYAQNLPIGLLLYYNLLYRRGIDKAHADLASAGVDAIVSADLPIEESELHENSLMKHSLGAVQLIAPNTNDQRALELFNRSSAFTYVLSGYGTTGVRDEVDPRTLARVKHLRKLSNKPMVVGFGISQPEQVELIFAAGANGAIVGSKFSSIIEANLLDLAQARKLIVDFTKRVKETFKI